MSNSSPLLIWSVITWTASSASSILRRPPSSASLFSNAVKNRCSPSKENPSRLSQIKSSSKTCFSSASNKNGRPLKNWEKKKTSPLSSICVFQKQSGGEAEGNGANSGILSRLSS